MADATLEVERSAACAGLSATQGGLCRDGKVYAYGDVHDATLRVGVIREYDVDLRPTGRLVWLRWVGNPLTLHPTGRTWDQRWETFLGDTMLDRAVVYRLDGDRAWQDANLDNAVLGVIVDDAAVNGCHPVSSWSQVRPRWRRPTTATSARDPALRPRGDARRRSHQCSG